MDVYGRYVYIYINDYMCIYIYIMYIDIYIHMIIASDKLTVCC